MTFRSSTVLQHALLTSLHASAPLSSSFDNFDWIKSATSDDQFLKFTFNSIERLLLENGPARISEDTIKRLTKFSILYKICIFL